MATASRDFEFDRIEAFVKKHGATVLALQFPAHLLGAAPAVATALAARLGAAPEIYVLKNAARNSTSESSLKNSRTASDC